MPFHDNQSLNDKLKTRFKSYLWGEKNNTAVAMYSDDFNKSADSGGGIITNNLHACALQVKIIEEMLYAISNQYSDVRRRRSLKPKDFKSNFSIGAIPFKQDRVISIVTTELPEACLCEHTDHVQSEDGKRLKIISTYFDTTKSYMMEKIVKHLMHLDKKSYPNKKEARRLLKLSDDITQMMLGMSRDSGGVDMSLFSFSATDDLDPIDRRVVYKDDAHVVTEKIGTITSEDTHGIAKSNKVLS